MKKIQQIPNTIFKTVSVLVLLLITVSLVNSQTRFPKENFDALNNGAKITNILTTYWETWNGQASEDGTVSNSQYFSSPNSMEIVDEADLLLYFNSNKSRLTSGVYFYSHYMYVPSGKSGYFNLQAIQDDTWGFEAYVNVYDEYDDDFISYLYVGDDELLYIDDYINFDEWMLWEISINIDTDVAKLWIDGSLVKTWTWSDCGSSDLHAVNYWGDEEDLISDYKAYFDEINFCTPTNPSPNNSLKNPISGSLTWAHPDDVTTYDVKFGRSGFMTTVASNQAVSGSTGTYSYSGLNYDNNYQWQIIYYDGSLKKTTGTVWSFSTNCTNPTIAGTIATAQTICYNLAPNAFTSSALPSGHNGTLEYKWQKSTTSSSEGFTDISNSNSTTYTSGALSQTTWFKRLASVTCKSDWNGAAESNVIEVTVRPQFTAGAINTTGENFCDIADPAEIGSATDASGGDNTITYSWELSTTNSTSGFTSISSTNSATYNPPSGLTQTTWYRRKANDGTCNTTPTMSTGVWKITVLPQFTTGAINTTGETICYNSDPAEIGSATDASGGDNSITYGWELSTTNSTSGFSSISSSNSATYNPPTGLTQTTWYRRKANDGACNTTPTLSTGVWKVTVRPQFTVGAINTTGETICYGEDPIEIGSATDASGGDNSITYSWELSTTSSTSGFGSISSTNSATYDPSSGLTQTTWYRRKANDGTCNTTPTLSTGVWQVKVNSLEVWVDGSFNSNTAGWGVTHFNDLTTALSNACTPGIVNISNYTHSGDVDMTGRTFIIGDADFTLTGDLSGGLIQTTNQGKLVMKNFTPGTAKTFPITDGTNDFTITINIPTASDKDISMNIISKQVSKTLTSKFVVIGGDANLNATMTLRVDKSTIAPKTLGSTSNLRYFSSTKNKYVPYDGNKVNIGEFDDYYIITITGVNEF